MGKKRIVSKPTEEKDLEKKSSAVKIGGIGVKRLLSGRVYINATYNNTIITVTDDKGNVLASSSAGAVGFKGAKKSTPYAASKVSEAVIEKLKKISIGELVIYLKGVGSGRESAIRSLAVKGLNIVSIKDVTPVPHNGTRAPKRRRV